MTSIGITIAEQHITEAKIYDIIFPQSFQQLFPFYIVTLYGIENKSTAEHGNIFFNRLAGNLFPFSLNITFI